MMHAAPMSLRRTRLRASDKMALLGTLSSMLQRVRTSSVRIVVFNLEQQKEIFRLDPFGPDALEKISDSMNQLELATVDYRVLQNRRGHVDLLADLVNQELAEKAPSDVVIFLGPPARFWDKLPQDLLEKPAGGAPPFLYFQLTPYLRPGDSFSDSISSAVAKLKGKTVIIRTPGEFAKALSQIGAS